MTQPRIGQDEWVSRFGENYRGAGLRGMLEYLSKRMPVWSQFAILIAIGLAIPLFTDNTYYLRVIGDITLMICLALGLNVVVGYAGLLDLGFVAFYGVGAYTYAYVSADFTGIHLPSMVAIAVAIVVTTLFGLVLGSPSLRLTGDYLAIVTLGFGQLFVNLTTSLTRVNPFWSDREEPIDLTGGPNGITNLDDLNFLGLKISSVQDYHYALFGLMTVILLVVYFLNQSRIGRAWRSIREDELAAEAMGMPTASLKLLAFAIGAGIAGLAGAFFAARQGSVFPGNFDVDLLITVYAVIVLGGIGSLPGVLIGAIVMVAMPEVLRDPELAGVLFYLAVLFILATGENLKGDWLNIFKGLGRVALLLLAVVVFSFAVKAVLGDPGGELPDSNSALTNTIRDLIIIPDEDTLLRYGNRAFGALVLVVLVVARVDLLIDWLARYYPALRGMGRSPAIRWARYALSIPAIYLLVFAWETRLSQEPSTTRIIIVGTMLVTLMIYRPHGLLGQKRVLVI